MYVSKDEADSWTGPFTVDAAYSTGENMLFSVCIGSNGAAFVGGYYIYKASSAEDFAAWAYVFAPVGIAMGIR